MGWVDPWIGLGWVGLRFYLLCMQRMCLSLSQYTDWNEAERSPESSVVEMMNDALYAAPATELAALHSISPSASTYLYCLNYSVAALGRGPSGRVVRGEDLGLVFGAAVNDGIEPFVSSGYTRQDRVVTEIIMSYWSNFIWTGSVIVFPSFVT